MSQVLCICGRKNCGKTTYIRKLVRLIKQKGFQVAVIKHDGHGFEADVPETDSYRFYSDGADAVAVFDDSHFLVHKREKTDYASLLGQFEDVDIVLIEGAKESEFPKAEIVRGDNFEILSNPKNRMGIISDCPDRVGNWTDEPLFDLNAPEKLLEEFIALSGLQPALQAGRH